MGRGLILTLTLFAAAVEPVVAAEPDLMRYAITQGGLLLVVLVLLGYIRYLHKDRIEEKNAQIADEKEKLQAMLTLVSDVKVALMRSVDANATQSAASAEQAKSLQSMAIALARIEERKTPR